MKQKGKTMQQITHDLATFAWAQSMYPDFLPPIVYEAVFEPIRPNLYRLMIEATDLKLKYSKPLKN